jgi:microcystin-dependent protein
MPRNGAGIYSPPTGTLGVSGTVIGSAAYDTFIGDLSAEITNSVNVQGSAPMLAALNMGTFKIINSATPVNATDVAIKSYVDAAIPPGCVFWFAKTIPPTGFLECNGASLSTTTYAALFAVIDFTFGGSGGSFILPDLRGAFIRGWDHGRGFDTNTPSRVFGSFQTFANATHTHAITQTNHTHGITGGSNFNVSTGSGHTVNDAASGSDATLGANANITIVAQGSAETTVKNTGLLPCIKF